MAAALRTARLIQVAMLFSIALYVVVGEKVALHAPTPNSTLFYAISFVSISTVGVIFVVRRTLVMPSEGVLRERPDDAVSLTRWKSGYIVTFALCETLALFGLVLRLMGFTLFQVWPFYLGGFALMLFFAPRAPQAEAS
jgi:hypothetical protein